MTPTEDIPADLQDALAAALAKVRDQLGPEGFEREMKLARARHERTQRARPVGKATPAEALNIFPELKRKIANQECRLAEILARERAAEQARQALCDIARAAVGAG
jgi:hypothetical protein